MNNFQVIKRYPKPKTVQTSGLAGGYAQIPSIAAYGTIGDFTIECWISRGDWAAAAAFGRIFDFGFNPGFLVTRGNGTDNILFGVQNSSFTSTTALAQDTWTHFAVVRNGTVGTIYFDGIAGGTGALTGTTFLYTAASNITIGENQSSSPGGEQLALKVTDVRLWKTARSQFQIFGNRYVLSNDDTDGLVGRWQFAGRELTDGTPTNNTMTIQAGASIIDNVPF